MEYIKTLAAQDPNGRVSPVAKIIPHKIHDGKYRILPVYYYYYYSEHEK
jgi:hypothetical protein